ncbi:MAG TPA: hypothetical protein PKD85_22555, partial [Saprospiraceae bacterium]|nr:hypothetical protein [Saprospiraceae bacterium]
MIYQSFWSKPFLNPYEDSFETRFQGGFPRYRYFFYTWALSTCRLKDHYGQVHLVTDKKGKEILIDNLKLPFSSVDLLLDDIEDFPSYMWAAGKCYFYSKINKPFIHFDGDFILGNNFGTYDIFDKITNNILVEFFYSDIYS